MRHEARACEPGLTGVWPDLGLAGVPGRVTDSICPSACP